MCHEDLSRLQIWIFSRYFGDDVGSGPVRNPPEDALQCGPVKAHRDGWRVSAQKLPHSLLERLGRITESVFGQFGMLNDSDAGRLFEWSQRIHAAFPWGGMKLGYPIISQLRGDDLALLDTAGCERAGNFTPVALFQLDRLTALA